MANDTVPIKIDKNNLQTPNPTTGTALYAIGTVGDEYELWLEVPGPGDDLPIANDSASLTVKAGSHFYTAKKKLNPGHA